MEDANGIMLRGRGSTGAFAGSFHLHLPPPTPQSSRACLETTISASAMQSSRRHGIASMRILACRMSIGLSSGPSPASTPSPSPQPTQTYPSSTPTSQPPHASSCPTSRSIDLRKHRAADCGSIGSPSSCRRATSTKMCSRSLSRTPSSTNSTPYPSSPATTMTRAKSSTMATLQNTPSSPSPWPCRSSTRAFSSSPFGRMVCGQSYVCFPARSTSGCSI